MAISASVNGSIAWQASAVHYTDAAAADLNVPSGDVGIASFAWQNNNFQAPATITDSGGNVWTRRINGTSPLTSSGFNIKVAVYTSPIFPAGDATWNMAMVDASGSNYSLDNITASVQFFSGFPAGSAAIDVAAWTGAIPSSAFTTTTAAELVAYVAHGYGSDITPDTGYTEGIDSTRLAIHWKEVSAIQTAATVTPGNCSAVGVITLTAASAGPVITGPSGSATGPTHATVSCSTDTSGVDLYHLILPAATAAPADAAALIANGSAVAHTVSATGAQSYNLTGLTTNTAVKVHFAQAGSNVASSASFTPNTLASSGTLSAQTGTAGGGITWAGVTPQSQLTNTGNGSGSWSIVSSAGFTVAPSINATTGVPSGGTLAAAGSYAPQIRYTDSSTVPAAQTITHTLSLTVSSGGGGDTTAPSITSTGTGGTNGPFSATVAENSTATFITFTSDEALASVTKAGTNGASYTLAGTGLTRTLARTSGFDYEAWVLAGSVPEVVTLAFADAAANVRNVTVNISPTNVNELPSAPTIGTATAGDQTVSIAFTAPVNTGKPTITGYTATLSPGGITKTGASSPIVFGAGDGVVNDTAYTGVVKATNSEGIGPDSSASNSVTPTAGAPTGATINSQPLANNNNVLLPDTLLLWVGVRDFLTGDPVALHTSITTDSSAQFSLYDAALNVAGRYLVDWVTEDFQHGRAEAVGE